MAVNLFILGLPGSGKSTIARYIIGYVEQKFKDWSTERINDYEILLGMFHVDTDHKKFRPTEHNGFDVLDLSIFDAALLEIEKRTLSLMRAAKKTNLIVIEFARNDYIRAFKQFSRDFVQNGYFLFLDAEIDICKQRIHDRVANPQTKDDHFVSEYIFELYYKQDNRQYLSSNLKTEYGIDNRRIKVIENNGPFQDILAEIDQFIDLICKEATL